jgi:hypothetical protein
MKSTRTNIKLKDFLGTKYDESVVSKLLENNQILIFPEEYAGRNLFNIDLIDLVKDLRNKGISVYPIQQNTDIIEKKSEDILLNLGIIGFTASVTTILNLVGRYIYEKYVTQKTTSDIPVVKFTYYKNKEEKYISYEAKADDVANDLQNAKDDDE